jgi:amino acid transporter
MEEVGFRRNIGLFMAVMIGIGAMMGPGIFALPGELAHMVGPLGIFVYLTMGLLALFTALNYSELGASIPLAGGGYSFASRTLSRPVAFFTGWFFWIGNTLACSMYAVIFVITIRAYFWPELNMVLLVLLTTALFSAINLRGMSQAIKIITVMNLIELTVLVGIASLGFFHIEAPNLKPMAPMGFGGFIPAMALVYISYVGYELITVASEEIIAPGKTIPRAILITLGVGVAIYVFVMWSMMGAVQHGELAGSEIPFIFFAERVLGRWGLWAAIVATIMASLSAFSVTLGASSRVLYALGRDGHLPGSLAKLHRRYQTPHIALLVVSVAVALFASSGVVKFVVSVSDFGYLMGQGIVNYSAIALHRRMPNLRRPFKVAIYPVIPILAIISCWFFVPALETRSFVLGGILTLIGMGIYLVRPANRAEFGKIFGIYTWLRLQIARRRREHMRVLIIGGGRHGRNIAKRLMTEDEFRMIFRSAEHQITFIEQDEATCKELEQKFSVPIYQGDGTKQEILEQVGLDKQVGLDNVDVAIAASDDDGSNVIAALEARRLGMQRVIAIVQDPDYLPLLEDNGIVAISAPWATATMVENFLERPGVADLFEIGIGVASLLGVIVPKDARVGGKLIQDIEMPDECVVAAVIRGKEFVVPRGHTQIEEGDEVVFVGPTSAIKKAHDHFMLKK